MSQVKNILISGLTPSATSFKIDEVVINSVDGKAYIKKIDNTVVELGSGATPGSSADLSALNLHSGSINTFTGSFTDEVNSQVRITIDAIPTESIFSFREVLSGSFGAKASGSLTVPSGFGTGSGDGIYIDFQVGFVARITNYDDTTTFNQGVGGTAPVYKIGGVFDAPSTTQFLLTASSIINDNDDLGTSNISGITKSPDNAVIAGFLSSSVVGNTISFEVKSPGTFGNNIRVAHTASNLSPGNANLIPGSNIIQLGGGSSYDETQATAQGDEIGNLAVLDISGSNDSNAALKRMNILSFLNEAFISPISDRLDTLISQSNARTSQQFSFDSNGNGSIDSGDLLNFLAVFGQPENFRLQAPDPSVTVGTAPPPAQSSRDGLKSAGGVVDQGTSTITNGSLVIGRQAAVGQGQLIVEGTEIALNKPPIIFFKDKTGGDVGDDSTGVMNTSGTLAYISSSLSFEFDKALSVQGNISTSGDLIGIINGGTF